MKTTEISRKASEIAGALWDDREKTGGLAEQLTTVANEPSHGVEGELTSDDRKALLALATEAAQ